MEVWHDDCTLVGIESEMALASIGYAELVHVQLYCVLSRGSRVGGGGLCEGFMCVISWSWWGS